MHLHPSISLGLQRRTWPLLDALIKSNSDLLSRHYYLPGITHFNYFLDTNATSEYLVLGNPDSVSEVRIGKSATD